MIQRIETVQDGNCRRDAKQTWLIELQSDGCGGIHSASTYRGDMPENDPNYFTNESTLYTSDAVPLTILQRNTHKTFSNSDYIKKAGPVSKTWGWGDDWEVKTLATQVWGPEFRSPESVEIRSCCDSSPVTPVLRRQRLAQKHPLSKPTAWQTVLASSGFDSEA